MNEAYIKERFLEDIKDHKLSVLADDGVYRHLRYCREDSWVFRYDIVTWPGYLTITGDMGCYVFTRIDDMFQFFTGFNPDYWSEKCVASDRRGISEFSLEKYKERVEEWRDEGADEFDEEYEATEREDFIGAVNDELLDNTEDLTETEVYQLLSQFKIGETEVHDLWEWDFRQFTYHYTWVCYAIPHVIAQYKEQKGLS